jgi:predicted phosphodiesterase
MFKKHAARKSSKNPIFILFRLILSLSMFTLLLFGSYSAYKHFSGLDPLKLNPEAVLKQLMGAKTPTQFLTALSSLKIDTSFLGKGGLKTNTNNVSQNNIPQIFQPAPDAKPVFKFMIIADSHTDNLNLKKAITQAKASFSDIAFIIGLGDYTNVGTEDEFKKAKSELDLSSLRYFLVPGDHDQWDCRNRNLPSNCNFKPTFGPTYQTFTFDNFRMILLNNADNYIGMDEEQLKWLSEQLELVKSEGNKGTFVFLHEPLYHPSSDHYMGRVTPDLKLQAKTLTYQLKAGNVKKIFAGDIHYFSEYEEPETKLSMVTIGAITSERNPQAPRFSIVSVYDDGSSKVEDIDIK